jgi:sulfonate transport system substrate-binding protein
MGVTRRAFGIGATAGISLALAGAPVLAAGKEVRVGFQKYGALVLLKGKGLLEEKLAPLGYKVTWAEFTAGPQMLEGLNAGAIDIAQTGEAPPIFAQAASPRLTYFAFEPPAPKGEAILVPKDSPIRSVADLRGKRVALNKGSNVHYLVIRALEAAGVGYDEIRPTFLTPADARAAFATGAVDAWAIWDPFQASAEQTLEARELVNAEGLAPNHQFYLGERSFVEANPDAIRALSEAIHEIGVWISENPKAAADELAPLTGIPPEALELALTRQSFGVAPLTPQVVADQQRIADTFAALGLLPHPVVVAQAVAGI